MSRRNEDEIPVGTLMVEGLDGWRPAEPSPRVLPWKASKWFEASRDNGETWRRISRAAMKNAIIRWQLGLSRHPAWPIKRRKDMEKHVGMIVERIFRDLEAGECVDFDHVTYYRKAEDQT